ncbi:Fic family protein [Kribbella sp. NPDC048928]|uniref:Fic family protein n=1 Tax=Kribbella sp. NPDC048928 TaxID=3364111 RepID=UPI00371F907D
MSQQITAVWQANPDAYGPRKHRRPCEYTAYVPDLLSAHALDLSAELAADIVDAERALAAFGGPGEHHLEQLARFLLRAEAVASSKIEGLQVNSRRLARHEARVASGVQDKDATADAVLGNVKAMNHAVQSVAVLDSVEVKDLLDIHRALMEHSDQPEIAGLIRTKQSWIGGNNFNPCQAAFVPPPPDYVEALLEDLCAFVNRDDLPGTVQAGMAHAQFETIHPFADGNGRTGRALIHVILKRRELTKDFIPPISLALATRASAYVDGLSSFRYIGPPDGRAALDGLRDWLDLFLTATRRATNDAAALQASLAELESDWRATLKPRKGSAAERLLPELIGHPVIAAEDVIQLTGASRSAAFAAMESYVGAGILQPIGNQQRARLYEAPRVFAILTDYERASATESGSTRGEQPKRAVPYRQNHP